MSDSVARRALLWWFDRPAGAHVSANIVVDFTAANAYLSRLGPDRPTVNALVAATIGRTLAAFPEANARVVGGRIVPEPNVGIGMPVNLLGHAGEVRAEVSLIVLAAADQKSLRELAQELRERVTRERSGKPDNALVGMLFRVAEVLPKPAFDRFMNGFDHAMQVPPIARRVYTMLPATTGLTNPGATLGRDGMANAWFRGGSIQLPPKLLHVGTLWGMGALQDEVVPVNGRPEVRPVLPMLLVFDHRLIDGVKATRLLARFVEILTNPAAAFGEDGERRG